MMGNTRKNRRRRHAPSVDTMVKKGRNFAHRRLWLPLSVMVVAVLAVYAMTAFVMSIPVGTLKLVGSFERVQREQVKLALAPELERGYFLMNLRVMREAVGALPWVSRARVQRLWPTGIIVWIQEQDPQAVWNREHFLDASGRLHPLKFNVDDLPRIGGIDDRPIEVLAHYHHFERLLRENSQYRLDELNRLPACCWHLYLQCGPLLVASLQNFDREIKQFLWLYPRSIPEYTDSGRLLRADLRHSNGIAVERDKDIDHNSNCRTQISQAERAI